MTYSLTTAGDNALLIDLGENAKADDVRAAAELARHLEGVESCIIGHSSLYLTFTGSIPPSSSLEILQAPPNVEHTAGRSHVIPVSFSGKDAPDLPELLGQISLNISEFRTAVAFLRLRARYLGFRPGFAYLEGLPESWRMPRRAAPRNEVPEGSLGIAGAMAAFYPLATPGGWNLIGRTNVRLWDPERTQPNLIEPGDEILWHPADLPFENSDSYREKREEAGTPVAEVIAPGQMSVLVVEADPKRIDVGLPPGGPFDAEAARAANRALGNEVTSAVMECTLVGPQIRFLSEATLSWYGAEASLAIDGEIVRQPRQFLVPAGKLLSVGRLRNGSRGMLAIRGGWSCPTQRYAIQPQRTQAGDVLRVFNGVASTGRIANLVRDHGETICVQPGPHLVPPDDLQSLLASAWRVQTSSDRVGVRFRRESSIEGPPADLPSCGMQLGTVQWHPNGELVAMGPDHPITGGYLQVMTVLRRERWKLAQLSPGDVIRWSLT